MRMGMGKKLGSRQSLRGTRVTSYRQSINWSQSPGQGAQLVRASFPYAKFVGLISRQGTCKSQPMNA